MSSPPTHARHSGLTLVELVVVLAILATVVGIAVASSERLLDDSRFERTGQVLDALESGLLGEEGVELQSGRVWVRGFVADVGRLPRALTTDLVPRELWSPGEPGEPSTLPPLALRSPAGDPEVRLLAGWRGPYVRLPLGEPRLLDGWGRPIELLAADGSRVAAGAEIAQWISHGSDGLRGGEGYEADRALVVHSASGVSNPPRHLGVVPVRVVLGDASGSSTHVVVRLYGPVDGIARTLGQEVVPNVGREVAVSFSSVPIGHRVLRAYLTDVEPADPEALVAAEAIRSPVVHVSVVRGGLPEVLIELD